MALTARKVRKLRRIIESERCPQRPGLLHDWEFWQSGAKDPFYSVFVRIYLCAKCGAEDEVPE